MPHERLKRLAEKIDELVARDEAEARRAKEIAQLRLQGAGELFKVCQAFVNRLNPLLVKTKLELDPPDFVADAFREDGPNVVQIHVRGRVLQIEYSAPEKLVSTENFRVPYVLEGAVRFFNQDLLDANAVEERLLFFCLERHRKGWRYFDARTYQSGPFDEHYLLGVMESII